MKTLFPALAALALFSVSCSGPPQNKEAVEKALREYLANRAGLNMETMDLSVNSVSFRQNEAEAAVTFRAKGASDPAGSMQMRYTLEVKDGKWQVKGKAGGGEHGSQASPGAPLPPGHPPAGKQ